MHQPDCARARAVVGARALVAAAVTLAGLWTPGCRPADSRVPTAKPARQAVRSFYIQRDGKGLRVAVDSKGRVVTSTPAKGPADGDIDTSRGGMYYAVGGLHDSHIHLLGTGRAAERVALRGAKRAALAERVTAFARKHPDVTVITGRGWDQSLWKDKSFPTWRDLEGATDKPVLLRRVDGHAALANRAMMKLAGVDKDTKAPPGGRIERDAEGRPTGVFVDTAMDLLHEKVPAPTARDRIRWLTAAGKAVADAGFVAAHDMGMDLLTLERLKALDTAGLMPIRVYVYLDGDDAGALPWLRRHRGKARQVSPGVRVMGVKLFADGAMGSRGAALLDDYSDKPGHRGALMQSPAELERRVAEVHALGAQVAIHAIGDHAVKVALDAIEKAQGGDTSRGHRIEHAQLVRKEDFARFARLGVTASMQPCHLLSDARWVQARLGLQRAPRAYAWSTMVRHKAHMVFGSDSPVEPHSFTEGLLAATSKEGFLRGRMESPPWMRGRAVDRRTAIAAYTTAAAKAVRDAGRFGFAPGQMFEASVVLAGSSTVTGTIRGTWFRAPGGGTFGHIYSANE